MANIQPQAQDGTLFPILQPLTGLARMAAEATRVAEGHEVEFRTIEVRSILNKSVSRRQLRFGWSINPYRGCEFACRYCYARYTHGFLAPKSSAAPPAETPDFSDPNLFERLIYMKENAAWLLDQELRRHDPAEEIAIGTATDPYQPIERTAGITRSLLEVLARRSGLRIGIVTKSKLIERDIDLLTQIARRHTLVLHLTITTPDAALARILEPRAPRPDLRFAAVRRLREAGLIAGILCSPLLPGITDTPEALDQMASRAAAARASFFAAEPLFLKSCSRPTFLSFVREHFPNLVADYATRFAHDDFASHLYRRQLAALVEKACRNHGLSRRSTDALLTRDTGHRKHPVNTGTRAQAALFA
jgi:DNA repair photolyase